MQVRAAVALLLALLAFAGATSSRAAFPSKHQRLLVAGEARFGGLEVGFLDTTTARSRPLGIRLGYRSGAAVSPDGTTIALDLVESLPGRESDAELVLAEFTGAYRALTANSSSEGRPSWTSDGRRLVYASDRDGDWDVYVADAATRASVRNLTADSSVSERNPRVSPDGSLIAFESDRTGNRDIYVMRPDGGGVLNLTQHSARDELGDWAPDSSRLVFVSTRGGDRDLYTVASTGGEARRLAGTGGDDARPAWSPDGTLIAFSSDRDGDNDVYTVAPDGSSERALTDNDSEDLVLDWQALRDTRRPRVHALASTGSQDGPVTLRYRASDDSGRVSVGLEINYRLPDGRGGFLIGGGLAGGRSSTVRSVTFPRLRLGPRLPPTFTFCLTGTDPSGNQAARSCARFSTVSPRR